MSKLFSTLALVAALALPGQTVAQTLSPQGASDCVAAMSLLGETADEADQDAFFSISMFFLGRLDASSSDYAAQLLGSFETLAADEEKAVSVANDCADKYQQALTVLDTLGD